MFTSCGVTIIVPHLILNFDFIDFFLPGLFIALHGGDLGSRTT